MPLAHLCFCWGGLQPRGGPQAPELASPFSETKGCSAQRGVSGEASEGSAGGWLRAEAAVVRVVPGPGPPWGGPVVSSPVRHEEETIWRFIPVRHGAAKTVNDLTFLAAPGTLCYFEMHFLFFANSQKTKFIYSYY